MTDLVDTYNAVSVNPTTRMDHDLYSFSAYNDRKPIVWPNGAKVAVAVVVNVDYSDMVTDPQNLIFYTYRDYGARVGVFRLMRILDTLGIKASLPVSDMVLSRSPRVAEEAIKHGWELVGHGARVNQAVSSAMSPEVEKAYLEASMAAIKSVTGANPRGWLGPGQSISAITHKLLAELGYDWTMDWGNDDQPYDFHVPAGKLSALPYAQETSDAAVVQAQSHTPWEYTDVLRDHLDTLLADSRSSVMTIGLQAHVGGQPFRAKTIRTFLESAKAQDGVWFATASEIIDAWRNQ